jgi:hypothetical protein
MLFHAKEDEHFKLILHFPDIRGVPANLRGAFEHEC